MEKLTVKITDYLLYLLVAYVLADYILRAWSPGIVGSLWDMILFVLIVGIGLIYLAFQKIKPRTGGMLLPLVIFYIIMILSFFLYSPDRSAAFMELRAILQYTVWFFIGINLVTRRQQARKLLDIFLAIGLIVAIYGIYQYIVGVEIPSTWVDQAEVSLRTRVFSVIGSPNVLGSFLILQVSIGFASFMAAKHWFKKRVYLGIVGIMLLCLIFTFSRGAWIIFFLAFIWLGLWLDKRIIIAIVLVSLLTPVLVPSVYNRMAYMLSPQYVVSSEEGGRIARWSQALDYWEGSPWTGLGLGRFGGGVALAYYPGSAYSVDNYYIKLLTEAGLLGLLAFLYLILSAARNGRRCVDQIEDTSMRILGIGVFVGLMAVIAHNMVENLFEFPLIPSYFWFFLGMLLAMPALTADEEECQKDLVPAPCGMTLASSPFDTDSIETIAGLKVLHVIGGGELGGAEELVLTQMNLLRRDGVEPHLVCLCPGPFAGLAAEQGLPAVLIPMRHKLDLSTVAPLYDYMRENKIRIVHTHGVRANLVARLAAKKAGIPVVTTVHSVLRYDYPSWWEARLAWYLTCLTNGYTHRFIAISEAIAAEISKMGVSPERISVIHSGLDMTKFTRPPAAAAIKEKLQIGHERRLITMVARLHPVKGHEYFLQAAQIVARQREDVDFLLVGEGDERAKITNQIKKLGLAERVKMTGYYEQVEEIYSISHILCVPSLMEGLGLVILEAMHFGVPVIASAIGGVTELIEDGYDGILVPPKDASALSCAMLRILDDESLRDKLIGHSRQRVEQFTVENMIRQVEEVYLIEN